MKRKDLLALLEKASRAMYGLTRSICDDYTRCDECPFGRRYCREATEVRLCVRTVLAEEARRKRDKA